MVIHGPSCSFCSFWLHGIWLIGSAKGLATSNAVAVGFRSARLGCSYRISAITKMVELSWAFSENDVLRYNG